jgi:hypothetical protein
MIQLQQAEPEKKQIRQGLREALLHREDPEKILQLQPPRKEHVIIIIFYNKMSRQQGRN